MRQLTEGRGRGGPAGRSVPPEGAARRAHRRRWLTYVAVAGPGIIAANAGNDAGGVITYASAGAQYRYRMLFFVLVVTLALIVVQEMCARLGTYTGKGLAALMREEFSIRVASFALFCLVVANVGVAASEFVGIGAALELLGVSRYVSVPVAALVIWALVLFGSYRYAERLFLALTLIFFTYPVAAFLGHPAWGQVGAQTLLPHLEASKAFILLGVALIGTTITPYMQLYAASAVADKGIGPEEYRYERVETIVGLVFFFAVTFFIIVATGSAIGHLGHPLGSIRDAAAALQPVAGSSAVRLFAIGLLGASALAGAVVPLSTSYAVSEAIGVERSVSRRFREAPVFLSLFTAQVLIGVVVALVPANLVQLLINIQQLNGIITPIILAFIVTLANRRRLLGDAVNGPVLRVVAAVVVVAVSAMSLVLIGQTVLGWFGVL